MTSTPGAAPTRNCVSCGRAISWDANVCPYCGHDYRVAMAGPGAQKKETAMPTIGGILIIIGAVLELVVGGALAAGGTALMGITLGASGFITVCGVILVIMAIIALLGGIFALQRKNFGFAVVGGIMALPGWFIPALIGLILVAVSKDEFR